MAKVPIENGPALIRVRKSDLEFAVWPANSDLKEVTFINENLKVIFASPREDA